MLVITFVANLLKMTTSITIYKLVKYKTSAHDLSQNSQKLMTKDDKL